MDPSPRFLAHVDRHRAHIREVTVADTLLALAADATARLIDLREDFEWAAGHAAGAAHSARGIIERDIEKLVPAPDTPVYLYCGGDFRSVLAADSLQEMGYTNVRSVAGGWPAWLEAAAPIERPEVGERVTGLGGVFFRSPDPKALRQWYTRHLGIASESWGAMFPYRDASNLAEEGMQVWNVMPSDTAYMGDSGQSFMINYRVRNLDTLLETLRAEGVWVDKKADDSEFGGFAWVRDADGNRIELWEPPATAID